MTDFDLLKENWQAILEKVRRDHELSPISFNSWLLPLSIQRVENGTATFLVPDGEMAIVVLYKKYSLPLRVAIAEITGLSLEIKFVSPEETVAEEEKKSILDNAVERAGLNAKYTFDNFVVGPNNKFANAAALAVAESPGEIYNPLYLYSDVGLGKTHLMQSICHFILTNNPQMRALYVSSEEFTNELIESIRLNKMAEFRDKYRNIDVLAIDDIQFIMGKESTQEEFFHTFNTLYGAKKQIIVSSDKPPKDLDVLEERIKSRLEMGLVADISLPDYETRMAILHRRQELEGFYMDEDILDYIASNVKSNVRILEGCVNIIKARSIVGNSKIGLEEAKSLLADFISPVKNRVITSSLIIEAVSEHFHLSVEEIRSQKRNTQFSYPRKIAMYLCRSMTPDSLQVVASLLNRKDHTTVMSAVESIENELDTSPDVRRDVDAIRKKIQTGTV